MSVEASGTFNRLITFTRGGVAHTPNNPGAQRTAARGNDRQIFLAISRALQRCAPATITAIKNTTGCGPNWRAFMTDAIRGSHHITWSTVQQTWTNFDQSARDAWNAAAAAANFSAATLPYATDPLISAGLAMFELSSALYTAGVIVSPGAPAGDNATAWAVIITGESAGPPANALALAGEALTLAGQYITLGA